MMPVIFIVDGLVGNHNDVLVRASSEVTAGGSALRLDADHQGFLRSLYP